jgi:transposase
VKKSTTQYKRLLGTVRPRDQVGRTRRRLIADELAELARIEAPLKALKAELAAAVRARGSHLMDLPGIGPAGAARILADVGDVARFPTKVHFASWTGAAPIDASSGEHSRHRLSRAGNRRLNHVLHFAAVVQLRNDTDGRAYFRRKRLEGKGGPEAMRCLNRRLSDLVHRQLIADSRTPGANHDGRAGPEGHSGATLQSSAVDLPPDIDTSDQSLPGPAPSTLPPRQAPPHPARPRQPPPDAGAPTRQRGAPTERTVLTPTNAGAP